MRVVVLVVMPFVHQHRLLLTGLLEIGTRHAQYFTDHHTVHLHAMFVVIPECVRVYMLIWYRFTSSIRLLIT